MSQHPKLEVTIVHCIRGPIRDSEFGTIINSDHSFIERDHAVSIPNSSIRPGLGRFFGLINFKLWTIIRRGQFDSIAVHGYSYMSFWIAFCAAIVTRIPILLSTDATELQHPHGGWWWKRWIKPTVVRFIYGRLVDIVLVSSSASWRFIKELGIPDDRLILTPFVADNDYFAQRSTSISREHTREALSIPKDAFVILYCGKLVRWKRPADLLHAFRALLHSCSEANPAAYLLFAGDGVLRSQLEAEARAACLSERVRFLGFVNYSELPGVYAASDVLVLPSEHEAWGVVVNEAMACGLPVVLSDHIGARLDLVTPGETGELYPVADVPALTAVLRQFFLHPGQIQEMGKAAQKRIAHWSYRENLQGWMKAVERVEQMKT
jgi:glycosyltransferase involved in cell wall biosynthesis